MSVMVLSWLACAIEETTSWTIVDGFHFDLGDFHFI